MSQSSASESNSTSTIFTDTAELAESTASRGRPSGYSERVIEMLKSVIRQDGSSDSAAAVAIGMGASTLTDWKRAHPEIKITLLQAREEFRGAQIAIIRGAAQAEGGRGWRAAAWLLERIFPADYAKSANDRRAFEQREERAAERERRAEEEARLNEEYARAGAAWEAEHPGWEDEEEERQKEEVDDEHENEQAASPRPAEQQRVHSETPFGNCGNSPATHAAEAPAPSVRHANPRKP